MTETLCTCCPLEASSAWLVSKAHNMSASLAEKTSLLSIIQHRATHSQEAFTASVVIAALLSLIVSALLVTDLCKYRKSGSALPIAYEQNHPGHRVLVKDMLRSRAKSLVHVFARRRRHLPRRQFEDQLKSNSLEMELFTRPFDVDEETKGDQNEINDDVLNKTRMWSRFQQSLLKSVDSSDESGSNDGDDKKRRSIKISWLSRKKKRFGTKKKGGFVLLPMSSESSSSKSDDCDNKFDDLW